MASRSALRTCALCLAGLCLLHGCSQPRSPRARPLVVVSVLPQSYFVRAIAGELVELAVLLPPGASPALWQPTLDSLRAISSASLYVKVGHPALPFEVAWLDRLLAENPDLVVLDCSAGLEVHPGDPHIWLSPAHARAMAEAISRGLLELLPGERATLEARTEALILEIDSVDAELRKRLADRRGQQFVVFHPAWGYLAREYGLVQVAIEAGHREPDLRELRVLIERARSARVATLFVQPQFDPESARVVAAEIGAGVELLDPLAYEWAHNLRHVAGRLEESLVP